MNAGDKVSATREIVGGGLEEGFNIAVGTCGKVLARTKHGLRIDFGFRGIWEVPCEKVASI